MEAADVERLGFLADAFRSAVEAADAALGAAPAPAPPPAPAPTPCVVDRRGRRVAVRFDLITERNEALASDARFGPPLPGAGGADVTAEVVRRFVPGMSTRELDALAVGILANRDPAAQALAARICVSDLHKRTPEDPLAMAEAILAAAPDRRAGRLAPEYVALLRRAAPALAARHAPRRDYSFRFFGFQTLARSYLLRPGGAPPPADSTLLEAALHERPSHLYLRVALSVFGAPAGAPEEAFAPALAEALDFYDALSCHLLSVASSTALNAGTLVGQLSSCFQQGAGDSIPSLFETNRVSGLVSAASGGTSVWLHGVRARGSAIRTTGGRSRGVVPFVQLLEKTRAYADQGGNRAGAGAVYLGADHADVLEFLAAGRVKGAEALAGLTAPTMKFGLWVPDAFMEALLAEGAGAPAGPGEAAGWPLFCPDEAPGLHLATGAAYRALRDRYVAEGRVRRWVRPSQVVEEAYKTWAQAGVPYFLFKDAFNRKSNLQNVAPICSSNLCCEVALPSWSAEDAPAFGAFHPGNAAGGEVGVCNLAAVCLDSFVGGSPARLDFAGVAAAAALAVRALNRVIDRTTYPSEDCRRSNRRHRPVGVGVMGLADVLARLGLAYGSPEALALAQGAAAALYFGALGASCDLARAEGAYSTFPGSPLSQGRLAPDLWAEAGDLAAGWEERVAAATGGWLRPADWSALRARARGGARNAYVVAYMPTATTSNIVGQNESFEPFTRNIYVRQTQAGEFFMVNRHLVAALEARGLWGAALRRRVIAAGGSVQGVPGVPEDLQLLFRTARELHPTLLVRTAAAMAPFVCQSMSLNLYLDEPSLPKILSFLRAGWRAGLKTGLYYCHTAPAVGVQLGAVAEAAPPAPGPAAPGPSPGAGAGAGPGAEPGSPEESALVCSRFDRSCTACGV